VQDIYQTYTNFDLPSNDDNEVHNVPDVAQIGTFVQNKT